MATVTLRNGRVIGDFLAPYIVAEINSSHFGDPDLAKKMIDTAKEIGCDCVKFQSWSADTLYCAAYYRENPINKRIVKKFSFDQTQLAELAAYSRSIGIDFSSTPYSREEAAYLLKECDAPFIKIASMELNNLPYLDYLGRLGAPLVLSTGMGTMEEIVRAVETIEGTGNSQLVILHCTSVYPAEPRTIRLNNILGLRERFPASPIGYSDHSAGIAVPTAAVGLGACLIEKHFTLDSSRIGMDNQMATETGEMRLMIEACRTVHQAVGGPERVLDEAELGQIPKMRRSLVTRTALTAGHVLSLDDLDAKRPGTGIAPPDLASVLGRKLKADLDADEILSFEHLE